PIFPVIRRSMSSQIKQDKTIRAFFPLLWNGKLVSAWPFLNKGPHGQLLIPLHPREKCSRPEILRKLTLKGLGALAVLFCTIAPAFAQNSNVISEIRVIGNRRIPKETVLARLYSHVGDNYDAATVERDFNSLWNTGYFEDVRIEKEDTPKGEVLDIFVREKPTIREINYKGLNSVTQSDVLDRFKKEKVGLSVESQYDPTRIARAIAVLKALLGEHGTSSRPSHLISRP